MRSQLLFLQLFLISVFLSSGCFNYIFFPSGFQQLDYVSLGVVFFILPEGCYLDFVKLCDLKTDTFFKFENNSGH